MKLIKTLISFLLLFAYSLGFAHNLVPHTADEHQSHRNETHTHEYGYDHSEDHDHSHIQHQDHLDSGWLDFMKCLLIDFDHIESNLEFFQPSNSLTVDFSNQHNLLAVLSSHHSDDIVLVPIDKHLAKLPDRHIKSPHSSTLTKRGPPSIS